MSPPPPNYNEDTTTAATTTTITNNAVNTTEDNRSSSSTATHVHQLRLLASTLSTYQSSIATSHFREYGLLEGGNGGSSQHNDQTHSSDSSSICRDNGRRKLPNGIVYTLSSKMRLPAAAVVAAGRNDEGEGGGGVETKTKEKEDESNCFRTIEWTPDGTSLVTTGEDNVIRVFVVYVFSLLLPLFVFYGLLGDIAFIHLVTVKPPSVYSYARHCVYTYMMQEHKKRQRFHQQEQEQ